MSFKKYSLIFALTLLGLTGLTLSFNRIVDPFWFYRDVSIQGFNAIKPKFRRYERHVKPALVQRYQPASLIFGSSFSEIGFDPLHPALRAAGTSFNFALAGASWEMVQCDVKFALLHDAALKQIVLGIHPEAMPAKDCSAQLAEMEHPEQRAFLFSYDAFEASINTILEQSRARPSHTLEGQYFYTRGTPGTLGRFHEFFNRFPYCKIANFEPNGRPAASAPAALDLDGLRDIVRAAKARGIALKLVVYPRHVLSFEQEFQCGTRHARWEKLARIVSMVQQESDGSAAVWDFEGYHEIGIEPISDAPGKYWQDPEHFNYEFGNIMLDEMFGIASPTMGAKLTPVTLQQREEKERKDRAAYLDNHPEFIRQFESLLPAGSN